jgi:hypothetical protein
MPSAEELRAISGNYDAEEDFIRIVNRNVDLAARTGATYELVNVPSNLTLAQVKKILEGNFPNCKISKRWWASYFKVSWAN